LQNCSFAITSLAKEEHARSGEALLQLKKIVRTLRDRLLELFEDKAGQPGDGEEMDDSDDEKLSPTDIEHAICLAMRHSVQEMGPCCSAGRRWKERQWG
jgi:hypothetical protein